MPKIIHSMFITHHYYHLSLLPHRFIYFGDAGAGPEAFHPEQTGEAGAGVLAP
jgi:hypothetical protein